MHIVYCLSDPITEIIYYVGYTSDYERRYGEHCNVRTGSKEKQIWIARLKKQGLKPIMETIEEYETAEELPEAEEYWYNCFLLMGAKLYNDPDFIGNGSRKGRQVSLKQGKKLVEQTQVSQELIKGKYVQRSTVEN